jgi:hypothetical protein
MNKQDFIQSGFTVVGTETGENKLLSFLKENYPNVIRDTEINLEELKSIAGLPIDEKVNGYGLNFVGRNFARAKYATKTENELQMDKQLSKSIDTTQNLVLKGDNLDSLKILKNHYSGKIKCIYIDPPYNTTSDEFVYPDKFDKEEAEVLGLANLSESDFARLDFSFKTKKSHNGWLAFMYPRLLLARDLLSNDGVIFISIDDHEQANLKLLCDDVFGEYNSLPPVISSITIERLNRAGEKIKNEIQEANSKTGMFEEDKKQIPDIGYKVFNSVEAPKLNVDETGQIQFPELYTDAISRIYNMVFTLGLDEPTQVLVEVVKDCIYKIGNHYYITHSENIGKDQFSECIKNGKVFVDGWTASLNATLQNYKEDVKIVF